MSVLAQLSRRDWLKLSTSAGVGFSTSGWFRALAEESAASKERKRACILLWMSGGPPQTDTFDMKPGHDNGGEFKPIDSAVPGLQVCEHLPNVAKVMNELSIIRSMSTKEGDHQRATYLMRTGYLPQGPIRYPTLGSLISNELDSGEAELPNFISIAPNRFVSPAAYGPGFLGPRYAPLIVGEGGPAFPEGDAVEASLQVQNLQLPDGVDDEQSDNRLGLLKQLEDRFTSKRPGLIGRSHRTAYQSAVTMMRSKATNAFSLGDEPDELRDRYGRIQFGQGCLLARRLIEAGVPFVEVNLNSAPEAGGTGWDTHADNFSAVRSLCGVLDPAWSTLISDLKERGLLETTMVVWMGEFGRTPNINDNTGRDHFPAAWTTVLGGGGIKGGQVYGSTTEDGLKVADNPVNVTDLIATVCTGLGLDPMKQNMSNVGRPIRLADPDARPVLPLLTQA